MQAGLYCALVPMALYALLGTSPPHERQFAERADRLETSGNEVWFAALTERVLGLAGRAPRWSSLEERGRVHPTVAAAVDAFLKNG